MTKKSRYNKWYKVGNGNIRFFLKEDYVTLDDAKVILLKIVDQAERDLVNLSNNETPKKKELWEQARAFLFDDDYQIQWGQINISFQDIADILECEIEWMRKKILEKAKNGFKRKNINGKKNKTNQKRPTSK